MLLGGDPNPFAALLSAHLRTLKIRRDPNARLEWKLSIFKSLFHRGWTKIDIRDMMELVDWLVALSDTLEKNFSERWRKTKEGRVMPHMNTWERLGAKKVKRADILEALETRFGRVPENVVKSVNEVVNLDVLNKLFKTALQVESLRDFKV